MNERTRLARTLFEIGKAVSHGDDLGLMLSRIAELVCELVAADACSMMLLDADHTMLVGRAAHGLRGTDIRNICFRVGEGVAGWVGETGEPALIEDVRADERFIALSQARASIRKSAPPTESRIRSLACVPLAGRERHFGVLTVTALELKRFTEDDLELLTFVAKTIALDVENLRLRKLAITDQLTGAYNRQFLDERLPAELERAVDTGAALSVAMVDVDHFKPINDTYGHDVGDLVLMEVAAKLRSAIRQNDLLIRYGGEEFVVVLPNTRADAASEVAERMRRSLEHETFYAGASAIAVRISVGVAEHLEAETPATLIRRADGALYNAKETGRNRVKVASP